MNGAWHLLTGFLSHGAWQPPNTHSVTPNPPTFLTSHPIASHYTSRHTVSLDPDISWHHVTSQCICKICRYAWTILNCKSCRHHLGWRFGCTKQGLQPPHFYGLSRGSLKLVSQSASTVLLSSDCSEHCIHIHSRLVTTAASLLCTISTALSVPCVCYFSARSNVPWHFVLRVHSLYNTHVPMLISAISHVFLLSFATHIYIYIYSAHYFAEWPYIFQFVYYLSSSGVL